MICTSKCTAETLYPYEYFKDYKIRCHIQILMCPRSNIPKITRVLTKMPCNCSCTNCDFSAISEESGRIVNITLSGDQDHTEFCSMDHTYPSTNKYRLACRSFVEDSFRCISGAEPAASSIIIVLSIICVVLLFLVFMLTIRKMNDNKRIDSLNRSISNPNQEKQENVAT